MSESGISPMLKKEITTYKYQLGKFIQRGYPADGCVILFSLFYAFYLSVFRENQYLSCVDITCRYSNS